MAQRAALFTVRQHQTPEFGVIIEPMSRGTALIRRGFAIEARRRPFARATGVCLRLSEAGLRYILEIENG